MKLSAKELRIGNYLFFNGQPGNVWGIDLDVHDEGAPRIAVGDNDYIVMESKEGAQIKPISLTEEWLLRLGFQRWKGWLIIDAFSPGHPSQRFDMNWSSQSGLMMKSRYQKDNPDTFYMRHIKHVHQLQNLYFALTGQELEINEPRKEQP